ncbi:MAG: 2OG-Fe(II) oxygenase [Vulcanimicrobiota bacterium]
MTAKPDIREFFRVLLAQGDFARAGAWLDQNRDCDPAIVLGLRGHLARCSGQLDEAERYYQAALAADPRKVRNAIALSILQGACPPPLQGIAPSPFHRRQQWLPLELHGALVNYVQAQPDQFTPIESGHLRLADHSFRRTRSQPLAGIRDWICTQLEEICAEHWVNLAVPKFNLARFEGKLTGYGPGGAFPIHRDRSSQHPDRVLSYVYTFELGPARFQGGEFRLYDEDTTSGDCDPVGFTTFVHTDNALLVFPSARLHELRPVFPSAPEFSHYRFAITGHIRKTMP